MQSRSAKRQMIIIRANVRRTLRIDNNGLGSQTGNSENFSPFEKVRFMLSTRIHFQLTLNRELQKRNETFIQ